VGRRCIVAAGLVLAAVAALVLPAAAASTRLKPGDKYVALGSSFASGPLIPPVADASCLRATDDYPGLVDGLIMGCSFPEVTAGNILNVVLWSVVMAQGEMLGGLMLIKYSMYTLNSINGILIWRRSAKAEQA
jgi:hypothetical protein